MNKKAIIPLVAGLCIGGLALKLGLNSLRQAQGATSATVQVYTPTQDIPRGTSIQDAMLTTLNYPAKLVPAGAFKDKKALVGRVPRVGAPAGVPIMETMLLPAGAKAGINPKPGFRAVSVKVDESSGVDNHLEPGAHVDVVGFFNTRRGQKQEIVARTLIENVEVAAVGQRISPTGEGAEEKNAKGSSTSGSPNSKPARAVTIYVKPENVPMLHLAEQRGKIKLSMRSETDEAGPRRPETIDEDQLLGESGETKSADGGLFSKIKTMFAAGADPKNPKSLVSHAQPPQEVVKGAQAQQPAAPKWEWEMTVWNGPQRTVLGWQKLNSIQAVELASSTSNARRDDQTALTPAAMIAPPQSANGNGSSPTAAPVDGAAPQEPANETDTETEPEELHE